MRGAQMSYSSRLKNKLGFLAASAGMCAALSGTTVLAAPWRAPLGQDSSALCGQGSFRFFGFTVYDAKLFGRCVPAVFEHPFALRLSYKRDIRREQLVQSSVDEMQRILGSSVSAGQLSKWRAEMNEAFVDVKDGDSITGVYLPGQGAQFYINDVLQHTVDDPAFARAFFGIWLDRETRAPGLRASLLGNSP